MTFHIRSETFADQEAIRKIHRQAFGQDDEARLVDLLRTDGYSKVSLVADVGTLPVGHILFSALTIETANNTERALALAPLAVLPAHQRQGIGSALVHRGLEVCAAAGHRIVIVLGHKDFYPRFGFSATLALPLESPYAGESFMATELVPHALHGIAGRVVYPPPFSGF